jgi:hypothetical protein
MSVDSTAPSGMKRMRWIFLALILFIGLPWAGCRMLYNWGHDGYRDGYVAKLSYQGHFYHSWEGDLLQQGGDPRTGPSNMWAFTITDAVVAKQAEAVDITMPVRLYYKKYARRPGYEGETNYRVYKIERRKPSPQ